MDAASMEATDTSSAPATSNSDQPPPPPSSSTALAPDVSFAPPSSSPPSTPTQNPQPSPPQNPPPQNPQPHPPQPTNPFFQNPQQRPPLGRARPFPNFSPHLPPTSSPSSSSSSTSLPSSSSSSSLSSSSSSLSSTHASSSSLPVPPIQRGGLALGVPAMRPQQQSSGSFSAFGPGSFNQQFGGFSRTPATISDLATNSTSQARPSLPGVQTIGMIGSLGSGSQMRPSGGPIMPQQRPAQPPVRSQAPPTNPSLTSQKFPSHGMLRAPAIGSSSSPSPATSQNSQIHQQPWISVQGKQMQTPSLPPSSYRPQAKPQSIHERAQTPQHPHPVSNASHQQLTSSQQQQQQQPHLRPNHSLEPYGQQYPSPRPLQVVSHQQQSIRTPVLANQKSPVPVNVQLGMIQGGHLTAIESSDGGNHILSKRSIQELVTQIDPSEKLDPEVEDILVDIAEDFVESITTFACSLAKHRKSNTLEAKDILLHLERNWNMTLPGFSGDEIKSYRKPLASDIHRERLTAIKKSATVAESGVLKGTTAFVATNAKGHAGKVSALGSERS